MRRAGWMRIGTENSPRSGHRGSPAGRGGSGREGPSFGVYRTASAASGIEPTHRADAPGEEPGVDGCQSGSCSPRERPRALKDVREAGGVPVTRPSRRAAAGRRRRVQEHSSPRGHQTAVPREPQTRGTGARAHERERPPRCRACSAPRGTLPYRAGASRLPGGRGSPHRGSAAAGRQWAWAPRLYS